MRRRKYEDRWCDVRRPKVPGASMLVLAALLGWTGPLRAQTPTTATITGAVETSAGRAVQGAMVELAGPDAERARRATTTQAGRFTFTNVSFGTYTVTARLPGLQPSSTEVVVDTAGRYVVTLTMEAAVLPEVVVTATRGEQELGRVPAAVSVVTREEIQEGRMGTHLEESLRRVPGVRVEDELGGTSRTRIIIRGTGTRANSPAGSGVRGVRILVDGIPKNNAGGSAQDLINVDVGSAQRIEVLRGPSSALYGNHSGGVVNVITQEGPPEGLFSFRQTVGSYGLFREQLKFGGERGNLNYFASVFRTDLDGYREQSRYNSTGFSAKAQLALDERSSLSFVAGFDRSFQETPGPLTRARFDADPRQADSIFAANDVHSLVEEFRLGATYRRELFGQDLLEVTGYYVPRHLGPFQQIGVRIPQDFTNRGGGVRYLHAGPLGRFANRLTVGVDYQNTPITTGVFNSNTGAALSMLEEHATTVGVYALDEFSITDELLLSVAGRFDHIKFTSENLAQATPVISRTFEKVTPKVGLTYHPSPAFSVYGTYSRGFEAPVIGELRILPGGEWGFNAQLGPQVSDNFEVGGRGQPLDWLGFQVAVFRQEVRDFISPFGTFPNNSFQNVGRVDQFGVEAGVDLALLPSLTLSAAYTFSDFTFDRFDNGVDDFSGNRLPGVPRHIFYGELRYRDARGLLAAVELQSASRTMVNDRNTESTPPFTVANARVGYEWARPNGFSLRPFLGVNNITDRHYSAFALINDAQLRFYNPLPEVSVYGGAEITF